MVNRNRSVSKRSCVLACIAGPLVLACEPGAPRGTPANEVVAAGDRTAWSEIAPLPAPVTNNAVAGVLAGGREYLVSMLGLDSTRAYSGIHDRMFRYDVAAADWTEIPGPGVGRIAATAQAVRGVIYLFGGYTVAADGGERSLARLDILEPASGEWRAGAPIPVPVDDAVSGVWRDSLVYLISGWHDRDNVRDVQVYDPFTDRWRAATPIPGPRVFGHSGAIAGNTIIYIDGVRRFPTRPRYRITGAAYLGAIDPADPTKIEWRELPPHPGPPLYRMAAAAYGSRVIFAGGTTNPYNYDGLGYDGEPSGPSRTVFAFNVESGAWETWPSKPLASMDHRGFAVAGTRLYFLGGMTEHQKVTARVQLLEPEAH